MAARDSNINIAYTAKVELAFDYKKNETAKSERIHIAPERIQYFAIDYKYECVSILPMIFISLKVPLNLHDRMVDTYKYSKFYFKLTKKDNTSKTSVETIHVNDTFSYICSNTEQNNAVALNRDGQDDDRSYSAIVVGLVSTKMTDKLRKSFEGIENNISVKSVIDDMVLKGLGNNRVMSPIKYDQVIDSFLMTPLPTRYRLLEYLFIRYPFFDTKFTFFIDFNNTIYLLDKTGKAIKNGSEPENVYINLKDVTDIQSQNLGYRIKNNAYYIDINSAHAKTSINQSIDQNINSIVGFSEETGLQELTIGESFTGGNEKKEYIRSYNAAVERNEIVNNTMTVELFKENLDSDIITPNKAYYITFLHNYTKYNGKFILSSKRETYMPLGGKQFNMICSTVFKRINSIEISKATKDTMAKISKANYDSNSRGNKSSSSNNSGKGVVTKVSKDMRTKS